MKITYPKTNYKTRQAEMVECSVEDAIKSTLDEYHADGSMERLQELINNQRDMMAALIQRLYDTDRLSAEFIKEQIKYSFTVD